MSSWSAAAPAACAPPCRVHGSVEALATGWVSMIQFEPSVGNSFFHQWVKGERQLTYMPNSTLTNLHRLPEGWEISLRRNGKMEKATCSYVIDGTELGDVAKQAGLKYHTASIRARTQASRKPSTRQGTSCRT